MHVFHHSLRQDGFQQLKTGEIISSFAAQARILLSFKTFYTEVLASQKNPNLIFSVFQFRVNGDIAKYIFILFDK